MGCEIHPHIEFRHPSETSFEYEWFASPFLGGDYVLFALLAGVRVEWVERHLGIKVEAVFAPRGIPDQLSGTAEGDDLFDMSSTGTQELDMENHSHSWLRTDELKLVLEAYHQTYREIATDFLEDYRTSKGTELGIELKAVIRAMETLPNARLVFWFDN